MSITERFSRFMACLSEQHFYVPLNMYRARQKKLIPLEKFDISGIVADFFAKFTAFIEEDSSHICCEFHYKN